MSKITAERPQRNASVEIIDDDPERSSGGTARPGSELYLFWTNGLRNNFLKTLSTQWSVLTSDHVRKGLFKLSKLAYAQPHKECCDDKAYHQTGKIKRGLST
jgi:hypothetical protein